MRTEARASSLFCFYCVPSVESPGGPVSLLRPSARAYEETAACTAKQTVSVLKVFYCQFHDMTCGTEIMPVSLPLGLPFLQALELYSISHFVCCAPRSGSWDAGVLLREKFPSLSLALPLPLPPLSLSLSLCTSDLPRRRYSPWHEALCLETREELSLAGALQRQFPSSSRKLMSCPVPSSLLNTFSEGFLWAVMRGL